MKRILIIDDDTKISAALSIRLRAAGYHVDLAADGHQGVALALQHRPDLIVLDVWMPGEAGVLTAQRLKHLGLADVPVVFLTSSRRDEIGHIAGDVGPAGFFEKPFDGPLLIQSIGAILASAPVDAPRLPAARNFLPS